MACRWSLIKCFRPRVGFFAVRIQVHSPCLPVDFILDTESRNADRASKIMYSLMSIAWICQVVQELRRGKQAYRSHPSWLLSGPDSGVFLNTYWFSTGSALRHWKAYHDSLSRIFNFTYLIYTTFSYRVYICTAWYAIQLRDFIAALIRYALSSFHIQIHVQMQCMNRVVKDQPGI